MRRCVILIVAVMMAMVPSISRAEEAATCPAVAVVAARGSDQNGPDDVVPTEYAPGVTSNGFEGHNIRGLLQLAERRHPGLYEHVAILPLDDSVYTASLGLPAIAGPDEEIGFLETVKRVAGILVEQWPHEIIVNSVSSIAKSMSTAMNDTPKYLNAWEEKIGCHPDYILVGYSQGALVLEKQVDALAGRLRGVVTLGNPLGEKGFMALSSTNSNQNVDRLDYCIPNDFVCDSNLHSAALALRTGLGVHTLYFSDRDGAMAREFDTTQSDNEFADAFASMVTSR